MAQVKEAKVDNMVADNMLFKKMAWNLVVPGALMLHRDWNETVVRYLGLKANYLFSVFETVLIVLTTNGKSESFSFDLLPHVQQPMIEKVVKYFVDKGPNPCSGAEGAEIMRLVNQATKK